MEFKKTNTDSGLPKSQEIGKPVFLGTCQSTLMRGDGIFYDFYQAGDILVSIMFPTRLDSSFLLFALPVARILSQEKLEVFVSQGKKPENVTNRQLTVESQKVREKKAEVLTYKKTYHEIEDSPEKEFPKLRSGNVLVSLDREYKLIPFPCPPLTINEPDKINVRIEWGNDTYEVGSFDCLFAPPPPMSEAERQALLSRPNATSSFQIRLSCNDCQEEYFLHASLEDDPVLENAMSENSINIADAPPSWKCKCGKAEVPLEYLKKGLPGLFRSLGASREEQDITTLVQKYEKGAISAIRNEYQELIRSAPQEEAVQKFLEQNPILWNFLSPTRILKKPHIINKFIADFGIVSSQNILFLIELEKPQTSLVKKGGGIHSQLQAGYDQIRDWQHVLSSHRLAVLEGMGLDATEIHGIKYLVIAGLARGQKTEDLQKLRSSDSTTTLYTFDDLTLFLLTAETSLMRL